jgi:alanine-synthesizing transaminase
MRKTPFSVRLERARTSGRPLLDLTEADPARCGLGWDPGELEALLAVARESAGDPPRDALPAARDAVASYLAGRGASIAPDRIRFTASRSSAHRVLLKALCDADGEVLVASPSDASLEAAAAAEAVRVGRFDLHYDGGWRLDLGSLGKAITRRTRAILVGNPSDPTGAMMDREDLARIEDLCSGRGIALIADEAFADTALAPWASALHATRCLAFHVSGLSGVCGLARLRTEWWAVAGPNELAGSARSLLERTAEADPSVPGSALLAVPALLARRERFLARLRTRLSENRAALAVAALGESPWSLLWGRGGCWAVLEIGSAQRDESVCVALLEDGVAVRPGSLHGLPGSGYLVLSLLPPPEIFGEALARLDRRLRAPLWS